MKMLHTIWNWIQVALVGTFLAGVGVLILYFVCGVAYALVWEIGRANDANEVHEAIKRDCRVDVKITSGDFGDLDFITIYRKPQEGAPLYITCQGTPWTCECNAK